MLWAVLTVAYELSIDSDLVMKWPASKLRQWLTYLKVKQELEAEAMKQGSTKQQDIAEASMNRLRALQEDKMKSSKRR